MKQRIDLKGDGVRLAADHWSPISPRGAVILLHGGGQTRHSWARTGDSLYKAGWRVVATDARGHGDSGWAADGDYSIDAFVRDLQCILQQVEADKPVLIGASLGGSTSLVAEGESGGLASALVLVDIVPRVEPAGVQRIRRFMTGNPNGFDSLEEVADSIRAYTGNYTRRMSPTGLVKNVRQRENGRWYWHWDPAFMPGDEPSRSTDPGRLRDAARRVTVPTLLTRGGKSDVVSQAGVEEFLDLIPGSTYVEVAGASHMVAGHDNALFTDHVNDFLDKVVSSCRTRQ